MAHIRDKSAEEVTKAVEGMSERVFEERLDGELSEIDKVLEDCDILGALKFIPGKQLLSKLAPRAGCKNGTDLMRSIKRNLHVDDYEPLNRLASELKASLAQQGAALG